MKTRQQSERGDSSVEIESRQPRRSHSQAECCQRIQGSGDHRAFYARWESLLPDLISGVKPSTYCAKVLHLPMSPDSRPRRNHCVRSAELPWVNDSGLTYPLAIF